MEDKCLKKKQRMPQYRWIEKDEMETNIHSLFESQEQSATETGSNHFTFLKNFQDHDNDKPNIKDTAEKELE